MRSEIDELIERWHGQGRSTMEGIVEGAEGEAGPDDIVLVAGKGHEPCQEVAGVRLPFDDTDVARRALEARA